MRKTGFLFAAIFACSTIMGQNTATTSQTGDNNEATVIQLGNLNNSTISSVGNENDVTVKLNGDRNSSAVSQQGNGNSVDLKVGFQTNPTYPSNDNIATISQIGNSNTVKSGLTWGDQNKDVILQNGDNNYFEIGVKYGNLNEISETTTGNENRTRFDVPAGWGTFSDGNKLSITKTGNKNYVSGKLEGDLNIVTIDQNGDLNKVGTSWYTLDGVSITGSSNTVNISQDGTANQSLNTILGDGNMIDRK
ncbi:MAG: hypothetical protein PWQ17_1764, partial [Anaerophaga sp.]|nr:hypothetical protein [Anaerophaga sp.]